MILFSLLIKLYILFVQLDPLSYICSVCVFHYPVLFFIIYNNYCLYLIDMNVWCKRFTSKSHQWEFVMSEVISTISNIVWNEVNVNNFACTLCLIDHRLPIFQIVLVLHQISERLVISRTEILFVFNHCMPKNHCMPRWVSTILLALLAW